MTKIENLAGSRKVAHILKVWSLLSTKIPISSVENSSVMSTVQQIETHGK
jgi:hypothetical protein